jgi:hypothetical protein
MPPPQLTGDAARDLVFVIRERITPAAEALAAAAGEADTDHVTSLLRELEIGIEAAHALVGSDPLDAAERPAANNPRD